MNKICPECSRLGMKSTISGGNSCWKTLAHYPVRIDGKGRSHHHDNNIVSYIFECSKHHIWRESYKGKECWCGWNKDPKKTVEILMGESGK